LKTELKNNGRKADSTFVLDNQYSYTSEWVFCFFPKNFAIASTLSSKLYPDRVVFCLTSNIWLIVFKLKPNSKWTRVLARLLLYVYEFEKKNDQ